MNSVKSIKKNSKVTSKLKVLGVVLMCVIMVMLAPMQVYADQKFNLRYYVTDTDTTFGTKGMLVEHTLSTSMTGINCQMTVSGAPSATISSSGNGKIYKCSLPYWSYHVRTTANCWTADYEQTAMATYKVMKGKKPIAQVDLLTLIKW